MRRTKEILSANSAAPITVEELHAGKDFQSTIQRSEFEELAGDFWQRAAVSNKISFAGLGGVHILVAGHIHTPGHISLCLGLCTHIKRLCMHTKAVAVLAAM